MSVPVSHAFVLPDENFADWFRAVENYTKQFDRVVIVRTPAGYDLNRFRNVSVVQTKGVWLNDNALEHMRRIYPSVVRVDVVTAETPAQMQTTLAERITKKDRFGETINSGRHLNDRFVVGWPSEQRPAKIVRRFNDEDDKGVKNEGIDIHALQGTGVRAATAGTVGAVITDSSGVASYGQYVQVITPFKDTAYLVTYANLRKIAVQRGQALKQGDLIGEAAGPAIKLIVQQPGAGLKGYPLPDVVDPTPLLYWDGLRLRATADGLRIRERPGQDFKAKGQVYMFDILETMELHGYTLEKVGHEGQWIRLRTPVGMSGFGAAWFLNAIGLDLSNVGNIAGMNLDVQHHLGRPAGDRVNGLGWTRFAYNVSQGRGSTDFNMADRTYRPYIERYAESDAKPIVVLGHQTYGEGAGYNWTQMDDAKWERFTRDFANACLEVAKRYAGSNLIGAYQIWNEQDTPPHLAQAAVPLSPKVYGKILSDAIRAIRSVDATTKIITGGHITGASAGPAYARATLSHMTSGVRPDGIAFHAYGLGAPGGVDAYSQFGSIGPVVRVYSQIIDAPVWITEWGVLDIPNEPADRVAKYATAFLRELKTYFSDKVAAAVWYAWADTMHNGYGLVDKDDKPKQPLYSEFMRA